MNVTIETKQAGKSLRKVTAGGAEVAFPPFARAEAAADKVRELMSKENIALEEALERPEVEQAARDADISGTTQAFERPPKPAAKAPEPTPAPAPGAGDVAEAREAAILYRRYLLSIANQRCGNFDELTNQELSDVLIHPRFSSLKVLSFEAWIPAAGE